MDCGLGYPEDIPAAAAGKICLIQRSSKPLPDPYYHTAQDNLGKISLTTLEENGELATATMYDWAKNPALREKKAAKLEKVQVYKDEVYSAD